jgi:uncharacterized membrane protein YphA (DoxX/SURF4 family)
MNKYSAYAPVIVRIGMSLVFLWFGYQQLTNTDMWERVVPDFVAGIIDPHTVVLINGVFEIIAGLCLITGFWVRVVAALLTIHLFFIALSFGLSATGIRDFGLTLATLSIVFAGADMWSVDYRLFKRSSASPQVE